MKAQTKAILTSLVVIAVALSAVSGVTYSWWSDSENTDITVGTGNLDVDVGGIEYWAGTGASGSFTVNEKPLQTDSTDDEDATSLSLITNIDNVAPRDQYFLQYDVTFSTTIYSKYMVQVETDVDWIKVDVKTVDDVTLTYDGVAESEKISGVELSEWTSMPGSDVSPLDGVYASHACVLVTITILDNAPQKPVLDDMYLYDAKDYVDAHVSIVNIITQELNDSDIWNGLATSVPEVSNGVVYIDSAAQLSALSKAVNSGTTYKDVTVRLNADLDLNNVPWTPIGNFDHAFQGVFDGQNHTIYNLNINQLNSDFRSTGLFGVLDGTITNLNIVGAKINAETPSTDGIAVVCGKFFKAGVGKIDGVSVSGAEVVGNRAVGGICGNASYGIGIMNCTVSDTIIKAIPNMTDSGAYDNGDKVGGIVGFVQSDSNSEFENNVVDGLVLTAYRDVGCIAGAVNAEKVTSNEVKGVNTITLDRTNDYGDEDFNAGSIVGRTYSTTVPDDNVVSGVVEYKATGMDKANSFAFVKNRVNVPYSTVYIPVGKYDEIPKLAKGVTLIGEPGESGVVFETTLSGTLEDVTFKNIEISAGNAQRWAYSKGTLVFEDCKFTATSIYAIHYDGLNGANITYRNCEITGWVAIGDGAELITFDGCKIYGNGAYGLIRLYSPGVIKNCVFDVSAVNTTDVYQDGIHAVDCIINVTNNTNVNGTVEDLYNVSGTGSIVEAGL